MRFNWPLNHLYLFSYREVDMNSKKSGITYGAEYNLAAIRPHTAAGQNYERSIYAEK